jgi:hypothetical protein
MARPKQQTVRFLCTGNYYRSRFAEILFNSVAGKLGLRWRASSRGLALERGVNNVGPMAVSAITALEAREGKSGSTGGARLLCYPSGRLCFTKERRRHLRGRRGDGEVAKLPLSRA